MQIAVCNFIRLFARASVQNRLMACMAELVVLVLVPLAQ